MTTQANFPAIRPSLLLDFANSGQVDPRVTFTRASTATYYDIDTVAKAEENLFQQSQTFDQSPWTTLETSVTANATTAPDGTSTADNITLAAGTAAKAMFTTAGIGAASTVVSVFAKANGHNFIQIANNASSNNVANFNITAGSGVVGTFGANVTSTSIVDAGNGWYRCIAVFGASAGTNTSFRLYFVNDASATFGGTTASTGAVYLWGAQLEQRSSVTAYTATTTQAITNYVPQLMTASAGRPRIDYNPITRAPLGLLIEESRQNLALRSDDFANASWTKLNANVTSNTVMAPDGSLTADKVLATTTNAGHGVYQSVTVSASTAYTQTFYAKAGEYSWLQIQEGAALTAQAFFNLSTGAVGTVTGTGSPSATIAAVGNGWYRCSLTYTTAVGQTSVFAQARIATADNAASFAGNDFNGLYIWGAQLEAGSFATSYIPTVASAVTRSADAASMTGTNFSSWFSNAEGTFYTELAALGAANQFAAITNPSNTTIDIQRNTSGAANFRVRVSGSDQANVSGGSYGAGVFFRAAGAYKVNDFAFSHNGSAVLTDTSGLIPVVSTFNIGDGSGRIAKIAYYPLRITNAQLQAITG